MKSNLPNNFLEIKNVCKRFGTKEILRDISLSIASGEFLTILGESGSGKTTLLRLIAGFENLNSGEIWMDGERIDPLPPFKRPVNTVFQQYALFPHLSIFENVAYGLRVKQVNEKEIGPRVESALTKMRMESFAKRMPSTLSGGQQQRIALARAIVNQPKLLLLDEPLSALDAHLRRQMQVELKSLQRELGITFIFVTHDQEEAMALSDRIALMRNGKLEQVDSPREIYAHPATPYAAQFIGDTNLISEMEKLKWVPSEGTKLFSLRPEKIRFSSSSKSAIRFRGRIRNRTYEGATELFEIECVDARELILRARIPSPIGEKGSEQEFEFEPLDISRISESN